jgi:hypothetical protein
MLRRGADTTGAAEAVAIARHNIQVWRRDRLTQVYWMPPKDLNAEITLDAKLV